MVSVAPDVPAVLVGDELRFSQVIMNLLSNAIKFTPEQGTVVLHMALDKIESNGDAVLYVEVKDTGIGLNEEQIPHLFSSFEQADGGIARRFGGTGLGLAISKRIVELMGGEVGVRSTEGVGSTFFFTARFSRQEKSPASVFNLTSTAPYQSLRVLAIDDSPEALDLIQNALANIVYSVSIAESTEEAMALIGLALETKQPFDLLLVDHSINGEPGVDIGLQLRAAGASGQLALIASPSEWNILEKDLREAVAVGYLPKPLSSVRILSFMQSLYDGEAAEAAAAVASSSLDGIFRGNCILLAEDIDINREVVAALLEETGVKLEYAENGMEVVRMFYEKPEKYDLILMDVQMPTMDGLEATRRICEMQAQWNMFVPIVAMTANAFKEDVEACREAGMIDHISKPIDVDEMIEKIQKYIKLR